MDTVQHQFRTEIEFLGMLRGRNAHRIPSSEDDFTFARMTSDAKGRNTTNLKITVKNQGKKKGMAI